MASALPAVVSLIALALPALAGVAAFLVAAAVKDGKLPLLQSLLDAYPTAGILGKLRVLGQLHPLLASLSFTAGQIMETNVKGADIAGLGQHVDQGLRQAEMALVPSLELPTFTTQAQAIAWITLIADAADQGVLDGAGLNRFQAHYEAEVKRLTAGFTAVAAVPAAPVIDIPGLAQAGAVGLGLAALLPLLQTLTAATTAVANATRNTHRERQLCVETTGQTIMRALSSVGPTLGIAFMAIETEQGRGLVDKVVAKVWDQMFDESIVPKPASPDTVLEAARTLFAEKAVLGVTAHLLAIAAEANANIKSMGVGYLAAFLADMAGFQRLANFTMGEMEQAAVGIPMKRRAMRDYRPNLPNLVDLELGYAKKEISPERFRQGMAEYGLSEEWIDTYESYLYLDPRMNELVRIGQFFNPLLVEATRQAPPIAQAWIDERPWLLKRIDVTKAAWDADWFFYYRAAKGGYDPADIKVIVETAKRAVVRREQTLILDAITRLYRDRFIDDARLKELTEEAWGLRPGPDGKLTFSGDPVASRIRGTQLRTLYESLADQSEIALGALSRGLVSEAEVVEALLGLGMPAEAVRTALLKERMGLVSRTRLGATGTPEAVATDIGEDNSSE